MRTPDVILFGDPRTRTMIEDILQYLPISPSDANYVLNTLKIVDTGDLVNWFIENGKNVMIEGSQGFDLDINYGIEYPHVTSRQCNAGQLVADCGISPRMVDEIIMIMRPYPIRISNQTEDLGEISSGGYGHSREISWEDIKRRCGAPNDVELGEQTTVTKKTRRVFELNIERLIQAVRINRPTGIAINFVQYLDWNALKCKDWTKLPITVKSFIKEIEDYTGVPVVLIGTGPSNDDIIDLREVER